MDKLDLEIEEAQRERDKYKALFDQHEMRLQTLKYAASLRPISMQNQKNDLLREHQKNSSRRSGKPPGSISMAWRKVLAQMLEINRPMKYDEIQKMADLFDIKIGLPSVRDRMRIFEQKGYVTGDAADGYSVAQKAIEKFYLINTNAAPDAEAPGPHKSEVQTDHTGNAE
jgi:hypothetical protein